jgi:hypothetical protein
MQYIPHAASTQLDFLICFQDCANRQRVAAGLITNFSRPGANVTGVVLTT